MIRWYFCILTLFSYISWVYSAPAPISHDHVEQKQLNARVFSDIESWQFIAEIIGTTSKEQPDFQSFSVGARHRFGENFKLGLFAQRQYGARHNEDWALDPITRIWQWKDSKRRGENHILVEGLTKYLLGQWSSTTGVLEGRLRYDFNFYNSHQLLWPRMAYTLFWQKSGLPFLNTSLKYEWALPLNKREVDVSERWAYIDTLFFLSPSFQLGPFVSFGQRKWATSLYKSSDKNITTVGGNFIMRF